MDTKIRMSILSQLQKDLQKGKMMEWLFALKYYLY